MGSAEEHAIPCRTFQKARSAASAEPHMLPAECFMGMKETDRHLFWIHKLAPTSYHRPEFNLFNIPNTNDAYLRHPVKSL